MKDRIRATLASLREQIDTLSPRDRMLATGLIAVVALAFAGLVVWGARGLVEDAVSRLEVAHARLDEVRGDVATQRVLAARLAAAEERMAQFKPSQMNTYVEGWATASGVLAQLKEVRETGTEVVGGYRERAYRVELDDADLPGVVKFLYAIETAPFPAKVRNATFNARDDRRNETRVIDLELEVVTYAIAEEEG